MKIVVIVRTREEEKNIARFCSAYTWADEVLVADANSQDKTREIASSFPNVSVRIFDYKYPLENGYERNSHREQINFLIHWAEYKKADWILFDDCDCWPNYLLKRNIRNILETTTFDYVFAVRLYLWGNDKHFPRMAMPIAPHVEWATSLYGWRAKTDLHVLPDNEIYHQKFSFEPETGERYNIMPPMCLLHNPWQDEEIVQKKLDFYRKSGLQPTMRHPLEFAGKLEPLPEWAKENEI